MNQGLNKVLMVGKIIKREEHATKDGKAIYNLQVEVKGQKYSDTIAFTAFGDYAIPPEGSFVFIMGRVQSRLFDGNVSYKFVVENIYEVKE
jgi:phage gp45-like